MPRRSTRSRRRVIASSERIFTATTEIYTEENTLSLHDALPIYVDPPASIVRAEPSAELHGASNGLRIEVERMNTRTQPASGERHDPTARARVEEPLAREVRHTEHLLERALCLGNAILVEDLEELLPVLTESVALSSLDLVGVARHRGGSIWYGEGDDRGDDHDRY